MRTILPVLLFAAGIITVVTPPIISHKEAHQKAAAFLSAHPELQGRTFTVLKVPLKSGGVGNLIIDEDGTGQPIHGHYILEFPKLGVLETTKDDAVAKTLSSGYFDPNQIPGWAIIVFVIFIGSGTVLMIRKQPPNEAA